MKIKIKNGNKNNCYFLTALCILLALYSLFITYTVFTMPNGALENVYKGYNHIKIYEDGSYTGENREGVSESGCILIGQCND